MYRDIALWNRVRTRVLENGESKTAASKAEGICTATIRKILRHTFPPGYNGAKPREARPFITHPSDLNTLLRENDRLPETARLSPKEIFQILQAQGYQGSSGAIRYHMHQHEDADEGYLWKSVQKLVRSLSDTDGTEFLASLFPKGTLTDKTEAASSRRQKIHAKQQMLSQVLVAQVDWTRWLSELERNGKFFPDALKAEDVQFLLRKLLPEKGRERKKSLVILARDHGFTITHIANFLDISINAAENYIAGFNIGGIKELFRPKTKPKKEDDEELKKMVFTLLHEPPSLSGLNRTAWRMSDLEIVGHLE